jgi:hypothetical protein
MKFIKSILIYTFSLLIILLLGELYLRFTGIQGTSNNKFDSQLGRMRRENLHYVKLNEGFSISNFNAFSYLGKGYPEMKDQNTFRIALIGDSYVEGFQVFERDHFRTILEDILNKEKLFEIQVLNFGRSGLGLENIYALDSLHVRAFYPDLVLYFVGNQDFYSSANDPLIPNVRISKNNSLIINNNYNESAKKEIMLTNPILQRSSYLSMLNNSRKILKSEAFATKLFGKLAFKANQVQLKDNEKVINEISDINNLIVYAISNDKKIILVNRSDVKFDNNILDILKEYNISYLDLSIPLTKLESSGFEPHYWKATNKYGHWNQEAHKTIGEYLAMELSNMISNEGIKENK